MISINLNAILIKTSTLGLEPNKHLGKSLAEMYDIFCDIQQKYGCNVCGEGGSLNIKFHLLAFLGEYESFVLDCLLYKKRIVLEEFQLVGEDLNSKFNPIGYIHFSKLKLEEKSQIQLESEAEILKLKIKEKKYN